MISQFHFMSVVLDNDTSQEKDSWFESCCWLFKCSAGACMGFHQLIEVMHVNLILNGL